MITLSWLVACSDRLSCCSFRVGRLSLAEPFRHADQVTRLADTLGQVLVHRLRASAFDLKCLVDKRHQGGQIRFFGDAEKHERESYSPGEGVNQGDVKNQRISETSGAIDLHTQDDRGESEGADDEQPPKLARWCVQYQVVFDQTSAWPTMGPAAWAGKHD